MFWQKKKNYVSEKIFFIIITFYNNFLFLIIFMFFSFYCFLDSYSWPKSLQNSLGRNRMPMHLFFSFFGHCLMSLALHPGFSDLWGSPPALSSTPTLGFFECLGIQFFNLPTCDLWDTMPCHRSPTLVTREEEDFPRGDNHSKHVPLPTYLAWLQPLYHNSWFVFIHVKTAKILLVVKSLIKKIEQQPH